MKITSVISILSLTAASLASPTPTSDEFPINDLLKGSMKPEVLADLQSYYHLLNSYGGDQRTNAEVDIEADYTAVLNLNTVEECLKFHLDQISQVNTDSYDDSKHCDHVFNTTMTKLEATARVVKAELDNSIAHMSNQFLECQKIEDVETALQCHMDLADHIESIEFVVISAKRSLEKIAIDKSTIKAERNGCISDVILKANLDIDAIHMFLLKCTSKV